MLLAQGAICLTFVGLQSCQVLPSGFFWRKDHPILDKLTTCLQTSDTGLAAFTESSVPRQANQRALTPVAYRRSTESPNFGSQKVWGIGARLPHGICLHRPVKNSTSSKHELTIFSIIDVDFQSVSGVLLKAMQLAGLIFYT